jgi:hypothetical protein
MDHVLTDKTWQSNSDGVRCSGGADCDTDIHLLVANVTDGLAQAVKHPTMTFDKIPKAVMNKRINN